MTRSRRLWIRRSSSPTRAVFDLPDFHPHLCPPPQGGGELGAAFGPDIWHTHGMNLRFWEWDRVFNLAVMALVFAVAASIVLSIIPITVSTDDGGIEVRRTIWEEASVTGALILIGLPVLIGLSPLMVLSKAGGIGRQQLINLWLGFVMMGVYAVVTIQVFGLAYLPAAIFALAAAVAGTVRRRSTATGRTAVPTKGQGRGIRLSKDARKQDRRRGRDR